MTFELWANAAGLLAGRITCGTAQLCATFSQKAIDEDYVREMIAAMSPGSEFHQIRVVEAAA